MSYTYEVHIYEVHMRTEIGISRKRHAALVHVKLVHPRLVHNMHTKRTFPSLKVVRPKQNSLGVPYNPGWNGGKEK